MGLRRLEGGGCSRDWSEPSESVLAKLCKGSNSIDGPWEWDLGLAATLISWLNDALKLMVLLAAIVRDESESYTNPKSSLSPPTPPEI